MHNILTGIFEWIRSDYKTHPFRFVMEVLAWVVSIGCSVAMAITLPNPPFFALYPVWITGCTIYAWAAWSRRSFGMLANYILLTTIDSIALIRLAFL